MKNIILIFILLSLLTVSVSATEYTAPSAPEAAQKFIPGEQETFAEGLWYIIKNALKVLTPELVSASRVCICVISIVLISSVLQSFTDVSENIIRLTCSVVIGILFFSASDTMIRLGASTVTELNDYGKLLMPVMTAAMAAQGGVTTSSALYTGTAIFNVILIHLITRFIVPALYIYLSLSVANSAIQQDILNRTKCLIKGLMTWGLKILLYVFTGYISITRVISGVVDASALKAAKLTISGVVPVVGNILSDATETILVSASVMKTSTGVYGIFAILAICIGPFIKVGVQYMLLKITAAICSMFGYKPACSLIEDFGSGMGFVLAMTGTACVMLLISTVCFLRGIGI